MTIRRFVALSGLLIAFAVPAFAEKQGGCAAVQAGSDQKGKGAYDVSFSAREILDIDFSVIFTPGTAKRFAGDHEVEFRIYTPNGYLYQSMTIPFTSDKANGREKKVEGYPRPLKVQELASTKLKGQPHVRVLARMPIAGTPIVGSSLYGTWRAEVYIDGETLPCAAPAVFEIVE